MRLTLRTLLAYLDDTMEPHEIKEIGQKVAESDAAQELIARIKQVTRRRRLTTPPATGAGAFAPNTIAEYLDNELAGDQVAELEKTCLESDVHLAEVASCHQILTLVLGEPALVPPTARERMYGLVKGREAIPFRKARGRDGADGGAGDEENADGALLPGLPVSRGWLVWALPLAALLVLVALAVAVWQALPDTRPPAAVAVKPNNTQPPPADTTAAPNPGAPAGPTETPTKKTWTGKATKVQGGKLGVLDADGKETVLAVPDSARVTVDGKEAKLENVAPDSALTVTQVGDAVAGVDAVSPEKTWTGTVTKVEAGKLTLKGADGKETVLAVPASAHVTIAGAAARLEDVSPESTVTVTQVGDAVVSLNAAPVTDERPKPPSTVRASAGRYLLPPPQVPSILVQRQAGQPAWKRLAPGNGEVFTTDDLVSLPGYNSELALGADGGTHLVLHGHVPQFTLHPYEIMDFLLESAARLAQPEKGFDADVTLLRGRIYLSNRKGQGPCRVRLRFAGEVWDLTLLEPGTEAGIDLLQGYTGDINYRTGESPLQEVYLELLSGRADLRIESREFANKPAPFVVHWDNKGAGASPPQPIPAQAMPAVQAVWSKSPPAGGTDQERASIQEMVGALDGLAMLMTNRAVDAALLQARETGDNTALRVLAVYSFGAIDDVNKVLDVLCSDADPAHAPDRSAAVFTIRRWLSRGAGQGPLLYDEKKETGLLVDHYHFRAVEARDILTLLYDFPPQDARQKATFEELTNLLRSPLLPIRELAYWHLRVLAAAARVALPAYNAGWNPNERDMAAAVWKGLIEKNELPPPPPMAPPPGK